MSHEEERFIVRFKEGTGFRYFAWCDEVDGNHPIWMYEESKALRLTKAKAEAEAQEWPDGEVVEVL